MGLIIVPAQVTMWL